MDSVKLQLAWRCARPLARREDPLELYCNDILFSIKDSFAGAAASYKVTEAYKGKKES